MGDIKEPNFIDRENERKLFWDEYTNLNKELAQNLPETKHIINYYGNGGIGKSELTEELKKEIKQREENLIYAYIDLKDYNNIIGLLCAIRNILVSNYKIKFKKFDLAMIVYFQKVGKSQELLEIKNLAIGNSVIACLFDFLSIWFKPFDVVKILYDLGPSTISFFENNVNKSFLKSLSMETMPRNIFEKLSEYMADDINKYLQDKNKKIVFFFDTFEDLDRTTIGSYASISKTKWLYNNYKTGLIDLVQKSIFVINSREEINFPMTVKKRELQVFDRNHAFEYLQGHQIANEEICNEFYSNYSNRYSINIK